MLSKPKHRADGQLKLWQRRDGRGCGLIKMRGSAACRRQFHISSKRPSSDSVLVHPVEDSLDLVQWTRTQSPKSEAARNHNLDPGPVICRSLNCQPAPNAGRPLTHAWQPEMSVFSCLGNHRIYADSVVADAQRKVLRIGQRYIDTAASRVRMGIANRFVADQIHFISNYRMHFARISIDFEYCFHRRFSSTVFQRPPETGREVVCFDRRCPQGMERGSSLVCGTHQPL